MSGLQKDLIPIEGEKIRTHTTAYERSTLSSQNHNFVHSDSPSGGLQPLVSPAPNVDGIPDRGRLRQCTAGSLCLLAPGGKRHRSFLLRAQSVSPCRRRVVEHPLAPFEYIHAADGMDRDLPGNRAPHKPRRLKKDLRGIDASECEPAKLRHLRPPATRFHWLAPQAVPL